MLYDLTMKGCTKIGFEGDGEVKVMRKKPIDIMAMQEDCWIIQGDLVEKPFHSKYQHAKHTSFNGKVDQSLIFLRLPIGYPLLDLTRFYFLIYVY